jgi:excisionase family DNA binding protein
MKIWLNVSEGAEYAGVCRDTIYTACERGELHMRIGGRRSIRLKREWIDQWFERHARQVRGGAPTGPGPADSEGAGLFACGDNGQYSPHSMRHLCPSVAANTVYNHRRTCGEWPHISMSSPTGLSSVGMMAG